jgi:hypothetical protein
MDFVPYVCPWAAHFLLIGPSAEYYRTVPANGTNYGFQSLANLSVDYKHNIWKNHTDVRQFSVLKIHLLELYCTIHPGGQMKMPPKSGRNPKTARGA